MLKIGDKVKIKKFNNTSEAEALSLANGNPHIKFPDDMLKYCGQTFTIERKYDFSPIYIIEGCCTWSWHESWLERISTEKVKIKLKDLV
jgi:hypothetical protein